MWRSVPLHAARSLEAELRHAKVPRPALLQLGVVGSVLVSAICLLFLVLAPLNLGSYEVDGEAVTGPEFLRRMGLYLAYVGTLCGVVAYGLLRERAWARPAMIMFWCGALALTIGQSVRDRSADAGCAVLQSVVALALAAGYLYGKQSVVAYYRALEMRSTRSRGE